MVDYSQIDIESVFVDETEKKLWCPYRKTIKEGQTKKEPISPYTGKRLSRFTMSHRMTFAEVKEAVEAGIGDGFGYYQYRDDNYIQDPLVMIDLDHVIDPLTGVLSDKAAGLIELIDTYWERTQSGKGVHGYARGCWPGNWSVRDGIEVHVYGFVVVTGRHIAGTSLCIENRQPELNVLHAQYAPKQAEHPSSPSLPRAVTNILDDEVIRRLKASARDALLYEGRREEAGYTDYNKADLAFVGSMVAMGCPSDQIDRVFSKSGMYRDKWDEVHHRDGDDAKTYGQMTIEYAMNNTIRRSQ